MNPLLGPQTSLDLPRFLPLSDAYSTNLRRLAFLAAHHLQLEHSALAEGTYAWVSGPTYETPAEGRFLRRVGADVVGMSTVPEVLAAREEGLEVMVLSLVTNFVVIPDTYRSIRDEVAAEVSPAISLMRLLLILVYFSSRGRSLSCHQLRRCLTKKCWLLVKRKQEC